MHQDLRDHERGVWKPEMHAMSHLQECVEGGFKPEQANCGLLGHGWIHINGEETNRCLHKAL
eukprot:6007414-Prorocentrum_lima.AAC.1